MVLRNVNNRHVKSNCKLLSWGWLPRLCIRSLPSWWIRSKRLFNSYYGLEETPWLNTGTHKLVSSLWVHANCFLRWLSVATLLTLRETAQLMRAHRWEREICLRHCWKWAAEVLDHLMDIPHAAWIPYLSHVTNWVEWGKYLLKQNCKSIIKNRQITSNVCLFSIAAFIEIRFVFQKLKCHKETWWASVCHNCFVSTISVQAFIGFTHLRK